MRIGLRRVIIGLLLLILVAGAVGALAIRRMEAHLAGLGDEVAGLELDLGQIGDGTYAGSTVEGPIGVQVRVTVRDHRITQIELVEHRSGRGAPAAPITERVVAAQSLRVDIISGATYSSNAILKAIYLALER